MSLEESFTRWCVQKTSLSFLRLLIASVLAGVYIGFAGQLFTLVTAFPLASWGMTQLVGGLVFSVGLVMVVLGKGELLTGNCLLLSPCFWEKKSFLRVLSNWAVVYFGNFLGSLVLAGLYGFSGLLNSKGGVLAERAYAIASHKVHLSFAEAFTRGILCNWLVALAVLLYIIGDHPLSRLFALPGLIVTFVTLGYEHSVANMYFLPAGMVAQQYLLEATPITCGQALLNNLLPVTLGSIVGGSLCVGFLYQVMFSREG